MGNSQRFIDAYNKIDSFLKKEGKYDSHVTFSQKVKNSKNSFAVRNKNELISLGELRNAIVHNPRIGDQTIADPHESTVLRIETLLKELTNPPKVHPEFGFAVVGAKTDYFINDILGTMKKMSFSQFPVFDAEDKVCELISTNTIARWFSSQLEGNGTIMLENIRVKDFIPEIEARKNYDFVARNTSVYEAYDRFIKHIHEKKRNLDALFITESGKAHEKLLGLITIEDIAKYR